MQSNYLPLDEKLDYLIVVGVSSKHDGSYVGSEF